MPWSLSSDHNAATWMVCHIRAISPEECSATNGARGHGVWHRVVQAVMMCDLGGVKPSIELKKSIC